jgi:hypothetical protein
MRSRLVLLCFTTILMATPALAVGDDAPAWLRQAAALKAPAYDKKISSVVLLDESTMTVGEDGRVTTVSTYAVRILNREGRDAAVASEGYETDFGKVREMHAWMIRPSGQVKSYGKDDVIDQAEALNDVYDESRLKKIVAVDDAEAGSVFGYQTITEMRPYFNQTVWYFQGRSPVISSRLTLVLPSGWRATGITFNHAAVNPVVNGTSYTWESRDLPPIEFEPAGPTWTNLAPRVAVNYFPVEGTRAPASRTFDNWTEVSRWYTELSELQATPDERLAAKARELTATARTEFDRIRAISRFVQGIQYISIQIGVGRWRPHAASEVFAKSYGDCKDKANLMRAMLKTLNITSYPVLIFLGDPTYVREVWASPRQFNHCIIAIKVADETQAATVMRHPALGRLLIFDATDEQTPIGDLPDEEQGSLALIAAGDSGSLVPMPTMPPESSQLDRTADVVLAADGSITASLKEKSVGQTAVNERRAFHSLSNSNYRAMIERWITRGATAAQVTRVDPVDNSSEGKFDLSVDFSALGYAQLMQNRLLVFKPAIVSRRESLFLTDATRTQAVVLDSRAFNETVRINLPAGFEVDELPDAVKLNTAFGAYTTSYETKDGQLIFTRKLVQRAMTLPVEQYSVVRSFFERIRAAEQSPVVLAKK